MSTYIIVFCLFVYLFKFVFCLCFLLIFLFCFVCLFVSLFFSFVDPPICIRGTFYKSTYLEPTQIQVELDTCYPTINSLLGGRSNSWMCSNEFRKKCLDTSQRGTWATQLLTVRGNTQNIRIGFRFNRPIGSKISMVRPGCGCGQVKWVWLHNNTH